MDAFATAAARLCGFACGVLGWRPAEFWAATPAELGCVVRALCGDEVPPAVSADLARLREAFPDG